MKNYRQYLFSFLIKNKIVIRLYKMAYHTIIIDTWINRWSPSSLSKLTPIIINMKITHLGSKSSKKSLKHILNYDFISLFLLLILLNI